MDKKLIGKVTSLYQGYCTKKQGRKKYRCGPYWFGAWYRNGKRFRVYIGKDLPKPLQDLLDSRYRVTGHKRFTWPMPMKRARR